MSTRLCITCHERPATRPARKHSPSRSYCGHCWQQMPCNQRAQNSGLNPARRAYHRVFQRRRIYLNGRNLGRAKTLELAHAIRAHIKRRKQEFRRAQIHVA